MRRLTFNLYNKSSESLSLFRNAEGFFFFLTPLACKPVQSDGNVNMRLQFESSPSSSPGSAAGGCVDARTLICSSHTEPCCRCRGPGKPSKSFQTENPSKTKLFFLISLHQMFFFTGMSVAVLLKPHLNISFGKHFCSKRGRWTSSPLALWAR